MTTWLETVTVGAARALQHHPDAAFKLEERGFGAGLIREARVGVLTSEIAEAAPAAFQKWAERLGCPAILFPLTNLLNEVRGFQGRRIHEKHYTIFSLDEETAVFGLGLAWPSIARDHKITLVEGPFDWAVIKPHIPTVVSTLTARLPENLQALLPRIGVQEVDVLWDKDAAGDRGRAQIRQKLPDMQLRFLDLPAVRKDNGAWIKDPGELFEADPSAFGVWIESIRS